MNKRHAGWVGYRLKLQINRLPAFETVKFARINDIKSISGLEKRLMRALIALNEYHRHASLAVANTEHPVLAETPWIVTAPALPEGYHASLLKNLHLVRSLVSRSYKAIRTARLKPAHGQRRWSNASMVKKANLFLNRAVMAYETELYRYRKRRVFQWSKQWEMRQKAKMRKKTKKKKWTKFKRFGEKRLAAKKGKKSPWD